MKGSPFILNNYYAPNNENGQIQEQLDHSDPVQDTQIIWGGDFNAIFDTKLDADGGGGGGGGEGNPQLKLNSVTKLLSIIAENNMCDVYRAI